MGLDKHMFLMQLQDDDRVDITSFYKSKMEAWKVFTISCSSDEPAGLWLFEEPVFFQIFVTSKADVCTKFAFAFHCCWMHKVGTCFEYIDGGFE